MIRKRLLVKGLVQGVGFRPFVFRQANDKDLSGFAQNTEGGVIIEIQGIQNKVFDFVSSLKQNKPSRVRIDYIHEEDVTPISTTKHSFEILQSRIGRPDTIIPSDVSTCPSCLSEVFNPDDRRYLYPFTHCIDCGPRFSIMTSLPYDRERTTMKEFEMCPDCREEYINPDNRRFHAQANACWNCGPKISLADKSKNFICGGKDVYDKASHFLKEGKIIAVKGLGGFQLWADARNDDAVNLLRSRKNRPAKPFALMFPSMAEIKKICEVNEIEEQYITSQISPIVLLKTKESSMNISAYAAPNNPYLGAMLPSAPLQSILLKFFDGAVIATSGNIAGEPICIANDEAFERLDNITDYFLIHDREIMRSLDDSVVQVIDGNPQILRVGRGYAPLEIQLPESLTDKSKTISFGGDIKSALSVYTGEKIYLGQHLGDLADPVSFANFEKNLNDLSFLSGVDFNDNSIKIVSDRHDGYYSSSIAAQITNQYMLEYKQVQHHRAHAYAAWLEAGCQDSSIVIAWDGTGLGDDNTLWGSEFMTLETNSMNKIHIERICSLSSFPLPGGEAAMTDPRRTLVGLLWSYDLLPLFEERLNSMFSQQELQLIINMLDKKINSHLSSGMGRLFDTVSALLNLCYKNTFEGEAPMALEYAAMRSQTTDSYSFSYENKVINIKELLVQIHRDMGNKVSPVDVAKKFHNTLVELSLKIIKTQNKSKNILLTGGVFQNRLLTELMISRLRNNGYSVFVHSKIPPNDGGLSVGQVVGIICA
jgi:hydrogenase maturation protein HypF